jgi:predicted enzyme related to lactoylglutathione lyase
MSNTIHWIEISTNNIERTATFYNTVLDIDIKVMEAIGMKTAFFPHTEETQSGGCLLKEPLFTLMRRGFANCTRSFRQCGRENCSP